MATGRLLPYILAVVAIELVGGLIGYSTSQAIDGWYRGLAKPMFNPPDWAFGAVWPILYALIAIAGVMIWRSRDPARRGALIVYAAQLAMNFGWTFVFFTAGLTGAALVWIAVLLALILFTIAKFAAIRPLAAWLLIPYAAWVAFATYLNAGIWLLNG